MPDLLNPTSHAGQHKSAGTDPIKLDELAAPTDVTTLNVSTSAHGLQKKLSNVSTEFLNGHGNYVEVQDSTTSAKGIVELATDGENAASVVVQGNDSRLSPSSTETYTNKSIDFDTNTISNAHIDYTIQAKKHIGFIDEFTLAPSNTANLFSTSVSGTGAAISILSDARWGGLWRLDTGTTTTGRAGILIDTAVNPYGVIFGLGPVKLKFGMKIEQVSAAAQEYILRIGFLDSATGNPVDGAWIEYDRLTSVNWRICTSNNSTATKTTSSRTASLDIGADTIFDIVANSAGTSIEFFVNGLSLGSNTTNIPTTVGGSRDTSIACSIIKSAGTSTRGLWTYYVAFDFVPTSGR